MINEKLLTKNDMIELEKLKHSRYTNDRIACVKLGYGIEYLKFDNDIEVQREIVKQGLLFDFFEDSDDELIRYMIASSGYKPEKYVSDQAPLVRKGVEEFLTTSVIV